MMTYDDFMDALIYLEDAGHDTTDATAAILAAITSNGGPILPWVLLEQLTV